jgi:hypothetical protein
MAEVPFEQMSPDDVAALSIPASVVTAVGDEGRRRLREVRVRRLLQKNS